MFVVLSSMAKFSYSFKLLQRDIFLNQLAVAFFLNCQISFNYSFCKDKNLTFSKCSSKLLCNSVKSDSVFQTPKSSESWSFTRCNSRCYLSGSPAHQFVVSRLPTSTGISRVNLSDINDSMTCLNTR